MQLSSNTSSSTRWVLSRCKRPKTLSNLVRREHKTRRGGKDEDDNTEENGGGEDDAATLSDVDRFLHENFKSLYIKDDDSGDMERKGAKKINQQEDDTSSGDEEDEKVPRWRGRTVRLDSKKPSDPAFGNTKMERFFSAPGFSSEDGRRSARTVRTTRKTTADDVASSSNSSDKGFHRTENERSSTEIETATELPENCIAVPKFTEEPYEEFRRSMLEMVESRLVVKDCTVDWDFMEELLLCYMDLNDKKSHRFILSAFVDLIVLLRRTERRIARKNPVRSPRPQSARRRRG